jgi:hypothetical protein
MQAGVTSINSPLDEVNVNTASATMFVVDRNPGRSAMRHKFRSCARPAKPGYALPQSVLRDRAGRLDSIVVP